MVFNTYLLLKTKIVDEKKAENINLLNLSILIICEKIEGMPGNIG